MALALPLLTLAFTAAMIIGYFAYGGWVRKKIGLDERRLTPAHRLNDGTDYVPTPRFYLFAQHFSAIAAAGPIAGPIVASQSFGWLPCLVWIALGSVLIGAVHDFSALAASVRHDGRSIAALLEERLGKHAGRAMQTFIWIALVYIIVAFADITAGSFVSATEELQGVTLDFNPGGAVAAASVMYLGLSIVMGLVQRYLSPPLWLVTLIFVPATFGLSWLGTHLSHALIWDATTWGVLILLYCAVASMLPVWLLLQPRGYLGGFVLYSALAVGISGLLFGGYEIQQPAFKGWEVGGMTGSLFPFLFVTIACGACSGFHGLVCSGTTSKQIDKETDTHAVGYGAMLAEGLVALVALSVVMIATTDDLRGLKPGTIYGNGIGQFLTLWIGKENLAFAITFGAMAFSTFVFDTLDVATRLGRYLLQELFGWRGATGATLATLLTIGLPMILILASQGAMWGKFWTLFGASNQLLAALTLLALSLWLHHSGKSALFTLLPMLFVLLITFWALGRLAWANAQSAVAADGAVDTTSLINALASTGMIALAIGIVASAAWKTLYGSAKKSGAR